MTPAPFEVVETDQLSVYCDGDAGPSGHPRVFLHMETEHQSVTCPYCSRTFVLKGHGDERTERTERAISHEGPGKPTTRLDLEDAH